MYYVAYSLECENVAYSLECENVAYSLECENVSYTLVFGKNKKFNLRLISKKFFE